MIYAIRQVEGLPESYPAIEGYTPEALAQAWQRIEHYIAFRYSEREVVWHIDADAGEWLPPLAPIVSISAQQAGGEAFEPEGGPMGGYCLPCGQTTVTATVGAAPVPEAVTEAVRRYAKYMGFEDGMPIGVTRFSSGAFNASIRREDIAPAKAMQNCGAADLLRAYRRVI